MAVLQCSGKSFAWLHLCDHVVPTNALPSCLHRCDRAGSTSGSHRQHRQGHLGEVDGRATGAPFQPRGRTYQKARADGASLLSAPRESSQRTGCPLGGSRMQCHPAARSRQAHAMCRWRSICGLPVMSPDTLWYHWWSTLIMLLDLSYAAFLVPIGVGFNIPGQNWNWDATFDFVAGGHPCAILQASQ